MVLCKYFQQGNCRFGTKCNNEHFDVKQIIKADVEAAINGKQWPFSCFGPFKDKPSIPNFIDDQSFEEMRFLCYEAKKKNYFDQFHQQFNKEAMDATGKMKALLQLTPEVVDVVSKVYDTPSDGTAKVVNANTAVKSNQVNPFGNNNATGTIGFGGSSGGGNALFAKPATGIFGGGVGAGNNTTSPGNIFGGSMNNAPQQSNNNIFGSGAGAGTNVFATSNITQQTSIFGQQPAKPASSIFGGGTQSSVFGQAQTGNIFAQPAQTTNTGLFAQASAQSTATTPGFGLFSQSSQQQQATQPVFGQSQNLFAQPQQPQQTAGIFGQTATTQPSGNLFAQAHQVAPGNPTAAGTGLFAAAPTQLQTPGNNLFAQAMTQQQQQQQQTSNTNFFAQPTQPPSGFFQQAAMQPQSLAQPTQTPSTQPGSQSSMVSTSMYSRMEDLTAEEIDAFKADAFEPGKIPFSPPPRELIN